MDFKGIVADDTPRALAAPRSLSAGWAVSIAAHGAVLAVLLWWRTAAPPHDVAQSPIVVNVVEASAPEPPGPSTDQTAAGAPSSPATAESEATPEQVASPEPDPVAEPDPEPPPVQTRAVVSVPNTSDILSDAQIAGAMGVEGEGAGEGSGGGGAGGCNMARTLQAALRRDPMVRRAVETSGRAGKAVMLWNGDWVRSGDQDGKGLSGVRQAILWELAFAPAACRDTHMRGLLLLSLADGTRFAIGTQTWRWSDLLGVVKEPIER